MNTASLASAFIMISAVLAPNKVLADEFSIPEPATEGRQILQLYSTVYHVHLTRESRRSDAVALVGSGGQSLGVKLSRNNWCNSALEGTATIAFSDGKTRTYNVGNMSDIPFTNCSDLFPKLKPKVRNRLGRMYFFEVPTNAPFGLGAMARHRLVPFRSIAVDPRHIPLGSILYIPDLRGKPFVDADGSDKIHDGFVMAVDTGGGIESNHIDFFTGAMEHNPFPELFTSDEHSMFTAYIVSQSNARSALELLHELEE
jgi:3D domain